MAQHSKIEWTETTWNPVMGCTPVSEGCRNCYARAMMDRFAGRKGWPKTASTVTLFPERLEQPLHWRKPRLVFLPSMGDLFHEDVPDEFIDHVWATMLLSPRHTFQVLTKRPERMQQYLTRRTDPTFSNTTTCYTSVLRAADHIRSKQPGLMNIGISDPVCFPARHVWLGVSVEDQAAADERVPILLDTPAAVRFVSCEPLLGPVMFRRPDFSDCGHGAGWLEAGNAAGGPSIDWVIVGGESGPGARPMNPNWARGIRDQYQVAGTPYFFKQWGAYAPWGIGSCNYMRSFNCDEMHHKHKNVVRQPYVMFRVGKHRAGRLLDGREWNEIPDERAQDEIERVLAVEGLILEDVSTIKKWLFESITCQLEVQ